MILDAEKIVKKLLLPETAQVADLGAGTGAFTAVLAHVVPAGKVYAIDLQRDLLSSIIGKLDNEHLWNVEVIVGDLEEIGGTKLREHSIDAAVLVNTLFQVESKDTLVEEAKRILKPGGKLLLVDWLPDVAGAPPLGKHAIVPDEASQLFLDGGFVVWKEIPVSEHHYGIIFKLPNKNKK